MVDRSISMRGLVDGERKWDLTTRAVEAMLNDQGGNAKFGLMIYPGPSGGGDLGIEGPVPACEENMEVVMCTPTEPHCTTGEVVVEPDLNTRQAILDAMVWPDVLRESYTPTWQSLEAAGNYMPLLGMLTRDFVVLITDGYQCCGLYRNENGDLRCRSEAGPDGENLIVSRVQRLTQLGITVFVVGFAGAVDAATLQRAAITAGTARPNCNPDAGANDGNQCYYQANNGPELVAALQDIARQVNIEVCDNVDNDCDCKVDEGFVTPVGTAQPHPSRHVMQSTTIVT